MSINFTPLGHAHYKEYISDPNTRAIYCLLYLIQKEWKTKTKGQFSIDMYGKYFNI